MRDHSITSSALGLLALIGINALGASPTNSIERVQITSIGHVALDGNNKFVIVERVNDRASDVRYTRTYTLQASAENGVILAKNISAYRAVTIDPRVGVQRTTTKPFGGYIYVFSKNERYYVDIELLEYWDHQRVRMGINGIHRVEVRAPK